MSPSAQVGLLPHGLVKFVSQRPKPYTNCMFAAVCVPLSFMGYDLPDDFVEQLRDKSGVPRDRATSTADTRRALNLLIDDCRIVYGGLDDDVLLRRLANREIVARVMIDVGKVPMGSPIRRHFKPTYTGGHAVALGGARQNPDGSFDVLWLDPMGRPVPTYAGTMVAYSEIKDALLRTPTSQKVRVTYGERDAALPESADEVSRGRTGIFAGGPVTNPPVDLSGGHAVILTRGKPSEFASVDRGTPFLNPVTMAVVTHAVEKADFRLAGRSTDGKFAGVWVRTRRVKDARGETLLIVDRELIGVPFTKPG